MRTTGRAAFLRWQLSSALAASVILAALAMHGCKDVTLGRANLAPVALPTGTPESGPAPLTVAFASSATDTDGSIVGYAWDFGDGATSSVADPTHLYASTGNFTATLTVTDNQGDTTSASVDIAVSQPANQPPIATASATPSFGKAPLTVTFTGGGTDSDGTIAAYAWMFGDVGSSTQQSPTHTYQTGGNFTATLTVTDNGGATGSTTVLITAGNNLPPTASASATPTAGKAPLTVSFIGTGADSDGTVVSYAWNFGDGGTSGLQNPSHVYQSPGNYNAALTVTDNNGAQATSTVAISAVANQPPTASASANPTSGIAPLAVNFTGVGSDSDGTIASYAWTFGDGGTSNTQNPSHTYQAAGSYNATLTVTDNNGATGSANVVISVSTPVNQPPTASASATPTSGKAPLNVAFTGTGSDPDGTIASYAWTFGDGGTSNLQNPSHTYQSPGNYNARLTVTDNGGATGSSTVVIAAVANQPPTATASASPTSGLAPLAVAFTGTGSDADGTIVSYAWTFGDGATSSAQNPSHTYQTAGNFTATLTVTDNNGATGSSSVAIAASAAGNQPPTASAAATPTSGKAPLNVAFTGSGSDSDGTIASYAWSFGDGGTSSLQNPAHTYQSPGNYNATLTVTDNGGATGSSTVGISVVSNQPPTASASATPTSGTAPLLVTFTGSGTDSDGTIASYAWTFGDGGTSSLQSPTHNYASAGSYTATLTVTDNNGASGSSGVAITVSVPVNQSPSANATATPTSGKAPLLVTFTGSATDPDGTIASYAWTFGDGGTSSLQNPTHTYQSPGNFTATLTVTDNGGATGSSTVGISVVSNQPPTASASATPTSGTAPLLVTFTGTGTDADGTIASYAWTFGDGGTSTVQNPTHTYASAGSYTASLTVTDNNGAMGSSSVVVTVSAPVNQTPIANAGPDQINRDPGTTIQLNGSASSDPDGSITSYQWTQTAGTTVTLSGAATATPTFVAPQNVTATYTFTLTVRDNGSPQLSAQDSVTVTTRVTYLNTTKALIDARPNQPNGALVGCTQSGCHTTGGQSPALTTYTQVYSNRAKVRSVIQTGGTMRQYLLAGEPAIVTGWIDNGAPERN